MIVESETETHTFYRKGSSSPIRTDTVEIERLPYTDAPETGHPDHGQQAPRPPVASQLVYEGLKPLDLKPGDVVLRVDRREDGSLCCITVLRSATA